MILTLHLGVSYRCNMKCDHCFVQKCTDRMDMESMLRTIRYLSEKGLFVIFYTFGEPTLSPLWLPLVRQIRELGIVQILMSNGYLIDDAMAKTIREAGISRVMISIDHFLPDKHDRNRGVQGAHRRALSAIGSLKNNGVPVGMATTVTSQNANAITQIYHLAESCGVSSLSVLRERKEGRIEEDGFEPYYDFFHWYILEKQPTVSLQFHDPTLLNRIEAAFNAGQIDRSSYEKWIEMNRCHCQYTLAIAPNGDIMRCNLSQHIIGNIFAPAFDPGVFEEGGKDEYFICGSVIPR